MKKNGFTLIEILGVITLLSLLSVIVIVSVGKSLKDSVKTLSEAQIQSIKSAASMWRTDHIELIPDNDYYMLSLSELQSGGYISDGIIDLEKDSAYADDLLLEVGINDVIFNDSLVKNGYKKLEYIESTGTQYIDTGVVANENTGFDIDFIAFNKIYWSGHGTIFGSRSGFKSNGYQLTTFNNRDLMGHFLFGTNESEYNIRYNAGIIPGVRQRISFRDEVLTLPDKSNITVTNYNFQTPSSLILFAMHEGTNVGEKSKTRLYSFKLYDGNTLIRNFIPCLDKNNKAGLYDIVENKFYGNSGTGDFVYKLPKDVWYTYLDYIGTTGTQYIDLKYVAKTNTEIRLDVQFVPNDNTYVQNSTGDNIIGRETTVDTNNFSINYGANANQYNDIYYWIDKTYASGAAIKNSIYDTVLPRSTMIAKSGSATFQGVTHEVATKTANNTENMLLFGNFDSSTNEINSFKRYDARIYGFQIYEDGILIRNMIPAMRSSDNQAGLYDELNDVFYPNAGTGEFTYRVKDFNPYAEMYTKLEYIESTGTQYIDTGYVPNPYTQVEMDFDASVSGKWVLGSRTSYTDSGSFGIYLNSDTQYWARIGGNTDSNDYKLNVTSVLGRHKIYVTSLVLMQDDFYKLDFVSNNSLGSKSLYIGAMNDNGSTDSRIFIGKIYSFKIFEQNEMIRNFVPCKRNSDNAIGLYDEVNDVFYTNSGTGTFGYGELN